MALLAAHRELFMAELSAITAEIKVIAALVGIIVVLGLLLVGLLYTGTWLFLGEWLFGSIGWGLLHGALATVAIIAVAALQIVAGSSRGTVLGLGLAFVLAVVLAVVFASNALRSTSVWAADQVSPSLSLDAVALRGIDISFVAMAVAAGVLGFLAGLRMGIGGAIGGLIGLAIVGAVFGFMLGGDSLAAAYPIIAAAVAGAIVVAVLGLIFGARRGRARGALSGLFVGALIGLFLGALAGDITYDTKGAVAIAVVVGLIAWPVLAGLVAWRAGLDLSKRFGRLVPRESIDAANETRTFLEQEWQRQRKKLTKR